MKPNEFSMDTFALLALITICIVTLAWGFYDY